MYLVRDVRYVCPKRWGRVFWDYMFAVALHTGATAVAAREHFGLLACLMPCALCQCHFREHLRSHSPPRAGDPLFRWVHAFKNVVNKRQRDNLGMRKPDLGYQAARRRHGAMRLNDTLRRSRATLRKTLPRRPQDIPPERRGERRVNPGRFARSLTRFASQADTLFGTADFFPPITLSTPKK